jgi:hypothetical protein
MNITKCTEIKPMLEAIAVKNPTLAAKLDDQYGFITAEDVQPLIDIDPSMNVMVRCYSDRFTCSIRSFNWHLAAIREGRSQYKGFRDVFIPCSK